MSIVFGGIRQLGMVVRDIDKAMREWAKLGIGPFYTMHFAIDDFVYRGQRSEAPLVTLAFAHSGPLQIELIEQHNTAPSAYLEFLNAGRLGAQHVASWFESHSEYDMKRLELLDRGFQIVHEGASHANDARFAYFETTEPGGLQFEIAEALLPHLAEFRLTMEDSARVWDGKTLRASELKPL